MTILKALSVIALLSAAISAPALARDARHGHMRIHPAHHHFRDAYNQRNERFDPNPGFRGGDPSRIGGIDPDLHPSAY
jgi:hypothetical protein